MRRRNWAEGNKATKSVILCAVMTLAPLPSALSMSTEEDVDFLQTPVSDRGEAVKEATALLKQFLEHDEARRYERCYDFFSLGYKNALKRESGIENRDEYKKMRMFKGLRWHNSTIKDVRVYEADTRVVFIVEMTFEQRILGERIVSERIDSVFELVKEGRRWVIDAWKYS